MERLNIQKDCLEEYLKNNFIQYTDEYSSGFDMGYLKGKISEIENMLDLINDDENGESNTDASPVITCRLCYSTTKTRVKIESNGYKHCKNCGNYWL